MNTLLTIGCLHDLHDRITTPTKRFFIKADKGIFITYRMDGEKKCISLSYGGEAENFLAKHGIISKVAFTSAECKMYVKVIITTADSRGVPVLRSHYAPITWGQIELNESQVQTIAANIEWEAMSMAEQIANIVGTAPVIKLFKRNAA